ncbi:MAG: 2-oxoacid:acceptor oxidoreductase family protein, partial [Anaerolineae bacterium]|nr:2-oxoacid:acceptor oxidoreductase family protein [Anaerolineae bacterium]
NLAFLRRNGVILVNAEETEGRPNGLRSELAAHLERLQIQALSLPASRMAMELGSASVTNTIMVGFAAAHPSLPLSIDAVRETLGVLASRRRELNLQALDAGFEAGQSQMGRSVK